MPLPLIQICYCFNDGDSEYDIPTGVAIIWEGVLADRSLLWVINQLVG